MKKFKKIVVPFAMVVMMSLGAFSISSIYANDKIENESIELDSANDETENELIEPDIINEFDENLLDTNYNTILELFKNYNTIIVDENGQITYYNDDSATDTEQFFIQLRQ